MKHAANPGRRHCRALERALGCFRQASRMPSCRSIPRPDIPQLTALIRRRPRPPAQMRCQPGGTLGGGWGLAKGGAPSTPTAGWYSKQPTMSLFAQRRACSLKTAGEIPVDWKPCYYEKRKCARCLSPSSSWSFSGAQQGCQVSSNVLSAIDKASHSTLQSFRTPCGAVTDQCRKLP